MRYMSQYLGWLPCGWPDRVGGPELGHERAAWLLPLFSPWDLCVALLPRTPGHSAGATVSAPSWEVPQTPPCRKHCIYQPPGSGGDNNQSVTQCGGVQSLHSITSSIIAVKIECFPPCCPGGVFSGGRCLWRRRGPATQQSQESQIHTWNFSISNTNLFRKSIEIVE